MVPAGGADRGIVLLSLLVMAVSGGMLWLLGLNYDGLTGSAAAKIHPATYLAVSLAAAAALRYRNPVAFLAAAGAARPASLLLVLAGGVLLAQTIATGAPGLAGAIDIYILPGLLGLLIGALPAGRRAGTLAVIERVVHLVMTANALLGLLEFVVNTRLFPYRFDGAIYEYDTRATSLQGHPLGNAAVTAVYVICLLSGGGQLRIVPRLVQIALQSAALVAFGGRSALALTLIIIVMAAVAALHRVMRRGRVSLAAAIGAALAMVVMPLGFAALAARGTFDAIQTRFTSDSASNGARLAMFELFAPFGWEELLIGPDVRQVESARRVAGLELGLENPLVKYALYNGLIVTSLLLVAVVLFLREIVRVSRPGLLMPMLGVAVLLNSFESLASKSTLLAKLAVLLLVLFRPGGEPPTTRRA